MTCSHANVPKSAIRKAYANFIAWKEHPDPFPLKYFEH